MNARCSPSPALFDLARQSVPRYTSYPTAPHFSPAVTGEVHGGWLGQVRAEERPVSLYLHVPFCRTICAYCGCATKASRRDEPIRAYAAALHAEIALVAERLGRVAVSHLHWGGGTPNILPPDCFEALVDDLRDRFAFAPDGEHAIELDPRHVTADGARLLARLGVTRVSLGVQTLDPVVQAAIGRLQPLPVVEASIDALRTAGIAAINVDLMYGLPFQTLASIRASAEAVLALKPSRIAIFGYAHVPWMKANQTLLDETALPDAGTRLEQAALSRRILEEGGYVEIGIDHFALPGDPLTAAQAAGRLRRNFQGYTDDGATSLIGLGASSISRTGAGYAQNAPDTLGWRRAVAAGQLPTVRGKAFSGEDLLRGAVIEDLLCRFEVDLSAVAARHGGSAETFRGDLGQLGPLIEAGWVDLDGDTLSIRHHRHEIARVVAAAFDAYRGLGGRHSAAV